jgi:Tol biopolymer transport system component
VRRPGLILVLLALATVAAGCGGRHAAGPTGWIVFAAGHGDAGNIAMVRPDGTGFRRLTHGDADVDSVTWIAKDRIAVDFASADGGDAELWTMAPDGTHRRLLHVPTSDHQIAVAPDGRHVVVGLEENELYLVDLLTGAARRVAAGTAPSFSADGALHFANGGWIWTRRVATGRGRRVVRGDWASFSPDGRNLAYLRGDALWMAHADGTAARRLASDGYESAAWSPDSRSVAWFCNRARGGALGICAASRADDSPVRIAPVAHVVSDDLAWGSRGLAFVAGTGRTRGIWTWDGNGPGRLLVPGDAAGPSWSPDGSRLAFVRTFPERPAGPPLHAVAILSPGGGIRQVTHPTVDSSPTASPDGRWIVFDRDKTTGADSEEVRLAIRRDGSGLHRVPSGGAAVWTPPETLRFAVRAGRHVELRSGSGRVLRSFPLPRPRSEDLEVTFGALLPDGVFGVGVSSDSLFCGVYLLTPRGPPRPLRPRCPDADEFAWSPDGSFIAAADSAGVWAAPVARGTPHRILWFAQGDLDASLAWSPDGRFLAVAVLHDQNELRSRTDIVVFDAAGHRLHLAVPRRIGGAEPTWIP